MLSFIIERDQVIIDPEVFGIAEVKAVWDNDKSFNKDRSNKIFLYVYYMKDVDSPFIDLEDSKRKETVLRNVYGVDGVLPDETEWGLIEELEKVYDLLNETSEKRLLLMYDKEIDRLRRLIEQTEPSIDSSINAQGVTVYTTNTKIITDAMKALSQLTKDKLDLKEELDKKASKGRVRGNKSLSILEKKQQKKQQDILRGE